MSLLEKERGELQNVLSQARAKLDASKDELEQLKALLKEKDSTIKAQSGNIEELEAEVRNLRGRSRRSSKDDTRILALETENMQLQAALAMSLSCYVLLVVVELVATDIT